jgi:hypothetical protein
MSTQPYKIEKYPTPEGHDNWLVAPDGRAIARLIPRHPPAVEIAARLSSSPLLQAALESMVTSYARRNADSNELLPEDEQPAEIREALAALRAASPTGQIHIGPAANRRSLVRGEQVPAELRTLVDEIGDELQPGRSWENVMQPEYLVTLLKSRAGEALLVGNPRGGLSMLAEFKLDGRTWLLWVEGDCCGVEPCTSLAIAYMGDTYGKSSGHAPDGYRWTPREART